MRSCIIETLFGSLYFILELFISVKSVKNVNKSFFFQIQQIVFFFKMKFLETNDKNKENFKECA